MVNKKNLENLKGEFGNSWESARVGEWEAKDSFFH
jgi:hypothetical protein